MFHSWLPLSRLSSCNHRWEVMSRWQLGSRISLKLPRGCTYGKAQSASDDP